jgi:DNA-binding SARP family transcriptional activator/predicted negative regulator of RcsB-dependent stress response
VPAGSAGATQVELRLAGTFRVTRDGTELTEGEIGSRKSRTLLKLLAVERPAAVPADRIVDVLWPAGRPTAPEQNVATLVSRLRAVLGADLIQGGRSGYRLADGPGVMVDLDAAARFCDQAEGKVATAAAVALAAAERGHALLASGTAISDEPYASWADPAREQVRELLRRLRLIAAEAAIATGDPRLAAGYAAAAMAADPLDEAAHRWYMSASAAAGEQAKALAAYASLRRRLSEELGVDPAPQTRDLHLAILREQDIGPAGGRRAPTGKDAGSAGGGQRGPTLVGREGEIRALRDAWDRAAGGQPELVMIVGEAGIGKTALAEFFAAEAAEDGGTVLRTRCYETERSLFLQPIVEAITPVVTSTPADKLRQMLGEHAPAVAALLPEAAAILGSPPSWRASLEIERRRAFEAIRAFLGALAEHHPVLVLVDDLQYAGQSTIELMHFLGRQAAGSRMLVTVTVRAENDAQIGAALAPVASRVEVGPLGPEAVRQLARAAGQEELAESILERTRGHTLFVVEVLRALASGDVGAPASLRTAVQARVRRAGAAVEALLRAASVVGAAVDPLALGALLDLVPATALELCEAALEARLLVVTGRDYEFANDLIREALYASTPEPTRLAYHRRAADLLTGQPESLARHAAAAGDWQRAARAWLRAAEDAMGRFAASDAAALATQAFDAAERVGDVEVSARALLLRGRAHEATGAIAAALADLIQGADGARAAGDRRLEMIAMRELGGDVPVSGGLPISYCAVHLERGLRIAESLGDRASEANMLSRLAIIAANQLRLDVGLDYALRGVAAGRAAADDRALAAGLDGLKTVYLNLGDTSALTDVLAELNPLLRRRGDLFLGQWAEFEGAFLSVAAGDLDEATATVKTALKLNDQGGYPRQGTWFLAHLGWLARLRGREDEAVTLGRRAMELTEQYEHSWWQASSRAMLGGTLLAVGDRDGAVELFERAVTAAQQAGIESYLLRAIAPLAAATGSVELLGEAAALLERATMPAGGAWVFGYEACLSVAQAWLGHGDPERARAVLAQLLEVARREPWKVTLAEALVVDGRALIRLGDQEQARSGLDRAARLAHEHGLRYVLRNARAAQRELS